MESVPTAPLPLGPNDREVREILTTAQSLSADDWFHVVIVTRLAQDDALVAAAQAEVTQALAESLGTPFGDRVRAADQQAMAIVEAVAPRTTSAVDPGVSAARRAIDESLRGAIMATAMRHKISSQTFTTLYAPFAGLTRRTSSTHGDPGSTREACETFYLELVALRPRDWMRLAVEPPIDEYVEASEGAINAINAINAISHEANPADALVAETLSAVESEARQVAQDLIPSLDLLRTDLRAGWPGSKEFPAESYQVVMGEAARRVLVAASSLVIGDRLSAADLAGVFEPFAAYIPLSRVRTPD